jgi:hypothetical protein
MEKINRDNKPGAYYIIVLIACMYALLMPVHEARAQDPRAVLRCSISAPDSIFFDKVDYNKYIPSSFVIDVVVTNVGNAPGETVTAFVQSNERFTTASPAPKLVASVMAARDTSFVSFQLTVKPRQESGLDTIRVVLSANGGVRNECFVIIWVEKEYRPINVILCPPANFVIPVFDDATNNYSPNPITAKVVIENKGDAPSKNTIVRFVATPEVSLAVGQVSTYDAGILLPNEQKEFEYEIVMVRRQTDIVVALQFRLQGVGGLDDPIHDTLCSVDLPIPAAKEVEFEIACENDLDIRFQNGQYSPNPFVWKTTVKNIGDAKAYGVRAVLALPPAYTSNDNSTIIVGNLEAGEEREIQWTVQIKPVSVADTSEICVSVFDLFGREAACCDSLILPAEREPDIAASCSILPDTIFVDPNTGEYQPAQFTVTLRVDNPGTEAVDSVYAVINISDSHVELTNPGSASKFVTSKLEPNDFEEVSWNLRPLQSTKARVVLVQFRITGDNIPDYTTSCEIFIHASILPNLVCDAFTSPIDTVHYDITTLQYEELSFGATVTNLGANAPDSVVATILLPPRISIQSGETSIRRIEKERMLRDSSWTVSWKLRPVRRQEGSLDTIRVEFRTGNNRVICSALIFVVGIPHVTALSIPSNVVGRYGTSVSLPVKIDNADGKDIRRMDIIINYESEKVAFTGFRHEGTLLQNWNFQDLSIPGAISFSAVNAETALSGTGVLVHLDFAVKFGLDEDKLNWSNAELRFDSLNSDINDGTILARYFNGLIYVSGDCLYPLDASQNFVVLLGTPNPFNPSTNIEYHLPIDVQVSLKLYNVFGQEVAVLENGFIPAGKHVQRFDASHLPAGTYICVLQANSWQRVLKLLLVK